MSSHHNQMLTPASAPRPKRTRKWDGTTAALLALLIFLILALAPASSWLYTSGWIMPGIQSLGNPLGGLSRIKAIEVLEHAWAQRTVSIQDGEQSWSAGAPELGLEIDTEVTVDSAFRTGRSWSHVRAVLRGDDPVDVPPTVTTDLALAERYLEGLAPRLRVTPVDAGVRVVEGRAQAIPPVPGRALDVTSTTTWLAANARQAAVEGRLPLAFVPVLPSLLDVSAAVEQLDEWLSNPVIVRAYDPVTDESLWWTAPPEGWGAWLAVDVAPGSGTLDWALDADQVRAFITEQAAALEPDRYIDVEDAVGAVEQAIVRQQWSVWVQVYHHPGQHTVRFGETLASIAREHGFPYPWLQQANPGVEALRPGQVVNIPSPDVLLPLPIVQGKRIVISISQQRMWAYEWGEVKWVWTVSTGIDSSPTSPGVFQVQYHQENAYASSWDLWMPYFIGIYRPVPTSNFMNGFHGFPTRDGASLLWTGSLGHPVTYGCVLVSTQQSALLYDWAEAGVVVDIRP